MKDVNIVTNIDQNYISLTYVWLYSLAENSNANRIYNIYLLSNSLDDKDMNKLNECIKDFANIKLFCIDTSSILHGNSFDTTWNDKSIVYYSNLFMPSVFPDMTRCIYMDVDMVVQRDMGVLFDLDIGDKCIAAVSAYATRGKTNNEDKKYLSEVLGIEEDELYFNNATMLMDLEAIRKKNLLNKDQVYEVVSKKLRYADQDAMNYIMKGEVYFLDPKWNVGEVNDFLALGEKYYQASISPYVLHYNGSWKPTRRIGVMRSEIFWNVARKTPFYEAMLCDLVEGQIADYSQEIKLEVVIKSFFRRLANKLFKKN